MSLEHLPSSLEKDLQQFASRQHITRDECAGARKADTQAR
jgi:hypothetical protein